MGGENTYEIQLKTALHLTNSGLPPTKLSYHGGQGVRHVKWFYHFFRTSKDNR